MYINAEDVLPKDLLQKVQDYVQGTEIYIPKKPERYLGWGEKNSVRRQLDLRNRQIVQDFTRGASIETLMEKYHLSYDSFKRIIRRENAKNRR